MSLTTSASLSSLPEDHFEPFGKPDNHDPVITALLRASAQLEVFARAHNDDPLLYEGLYGIRVHVEQARALLEAGK